MHEYEIDRAKPKENEKNYIVVNQEDADLFTGDNPIFGMKHYFLRKIYIVNIISIFQVQI